MSLVWDLVSDFSVAILSESTQLDAECAEASERSSRRENLRLKIEANVLCASYLIDKWSCQIHLII